MGLTKPELLKLSRIENLFTLIRQHKDTAAIRELAKLLRDAEALGSYKGKAEVINYHTLKGMVFQHRRARKISKSSLSKCLYIYK